MQPIFYGGFLLNYVIGHPYRRQLPGRRLTNHKTISLQEELVELSSQLKALEARADHLSRENNLRLIAQTKIKNGKVPHYVLLKLLEKAIQEFMKGYLAYAQNALNHLKNKDEKLNQITATQEIWIQSKIESLT